MTIETPVRTAQHVAARMRDGRKSYGVGTAVVHALDGVDVDVHPGTFTAVMGPSGSGKSTLLHTLAGLDSLDSGEVWIGDQLLADLGDRAMTLLRRDRVGVIFQAFNLVPTLSARENVLLPLTIAGRRPDPEWLDTVIDTIGLRDRLEHRPDRALRGHPSGRVRLHGEHPGLGSEQTEGPVRRHRRDGGRLTPRAAVGPEPGLLTIPRQAIERDLSPWKRAAGLVLDGPGDGNGPARRGRSRWHRRSLRRG